MPHITFIHGISNKPVTVKLQRIWLDALSDESLNNNDGFNPGTYGVTTSMIYWADVLYDSPLKESVTESAESLESTENTVVKDPPPDMSWINELPEKEQKIIKTLEAKLVASETLTELHPGIALSEFEKSLERIPLPWPVKKLLMKVLLKDVHHYCFNYEFSPRAGVTYKVQEEIRGRVIKALKEVNTDRHIVVSHSMGTLIMYDCLLRVPECPQIDGLMTIGSPLGIDEVQDCLKPGWSREKGFPEKVKGTWFNVYDMFDPVTGFDGNIANDFLQNDKKIIKVIKEQNEGSWRHDITKYFKRPKLRKALSELLNI